MSTVEVAARFSNTGPPPHANGEDWATYFSEYRRRQDALRNKNGLTLLVDDDGMETIVEEEMEEEAAFELIAPAGPIEFTQLPTGPKGFATGAAAKGWDVRAQVSETIVHPVLYKAGSKENAAEDKQHLRGDLRYPGYRARHFGVAARLGTVDQGLLARAFWTQKIYEGKNPSTSFFFAEIREFGLGDFLKAREFDQWQIDVGVKAPPKPKKTAAPVAEEGVWRG